MTVTVKIDVSSPTGRRLVRDLEKHKKIVEIQNDQPLGVDGLPIETVPFNEVYERGLDKLSNHYGVDMRKLKAKLK